MSTGNAFYYTVGQLTDSETESGDNVFKGFEHFISESHRAKLLPDLLYGIHFRRVWRNVQQGYIRRNFEAFRSVPGCSVANHKYLIVWILF